MAYLDVIDQRIEDVIQVGTPARADDSVKLGSLVTDVQAKATRLIKAEIELAKAEAVAKAKDAAVAIGLLVAAAFLAFWAFALLIGTVAAALARVLPVWAAMLIVAVALLVIAALLALFAKKFLDKMQAAKVEAPNNIKTDINRIKFALRGRKAKVVINEHIVVDDTEPALATTAPLATAVVSDESITEVPVTVIRETAVASQPVAVAVVSEPIVATQVVTEPDGILAETVVEDIAIVPGAAGSIAEGFVAGGVVEEQRVIDDGTGDLEGRI